MNALVGTKFKIVTGYPGGNEVNIAMERGEVDGRGSNSWASWKSTKPEWLKEKKIIMLVQVGLTRSPELPDVPLLLELVSNDLDRKVMTFCQPKLRFRVRSSPQPTCLQSAWRHCAAPSTRP